MAKYTCSKTKDEILEIIAEEFRKVNKDYDDAMQNDNDKLKERNQGIIMNPPFSNGCKHLLKALEMQQRNGGAVICLLNAETLKNECNNERIMLNRMLEEYNADIQYIQDAFMDAERKTSVEIALIKVKLPDVQRNSFIFDSLEKAKEQREYTYNTENTQLAENDFLKAIVEQYKMEIEAGVKLIKEYYAMSPHILYQFGKDKQTGQTIQTGGCVLNLSIGKDSASVNGYIREIRGKYWSALFDNPKFIGQLTNNLQREYYNKVEELKDYEFSLHNIYELKIDMSKKVIKGIEDTIISLFEELSNKYSYYDECSKNIHYFNGWKTNKAWIINKKVIIPLRGWRDLEYSWGGFKPSDREVVNKLRDSLYGTPLESTTYKFAKCLKSRFGSDIFEKLDGFDRNYITNSYHIPVFEHITAFEKLRIESKFQKLSPGGAISYIEVPSMSHNIPAILEVIKFIYNNIMYAEINTKSCYCEKCGFDGDIPLVSDENNKLKWECPSCGNTDNTTMDIAFRVCGYIGTAKNGGNQGRYGDIHDRVYHLDDMEYTED